VEDGRCHGVKKAVQGTVRLTAGRHVRQAAQALVGILYPPRCGARLGSVVWSSQLRGCLRRSALARGPMTFCPLLWRLPRCCAPTNTCCLLSRRCAGVRTRPPRGPLKMSHGEGLPPVASGGGETLPPVQRDAGPEVGDMWGKPPVTGGTAPVMSRRRVASNHVTPPEGGSV